MSPTANHCIAVGGGALDAPAERAIHESSANRNRHCRGTDSSSQAPQNDTGKVESLLCHSERRAKPGVEESASLRKGERILRCAQNDTEDGMFKYHFALCALHLCIPGQERINPFPTKTKVQSVTGRYTLHFVFYRFWVCSCTRSSSEMMVLEIRKPLGVSFQRPS